MPAADSAGGATGLPDLPRDARGFAAADLARGVADELLFGDFGVLAIARIYGPPPPTRQGVIKLWKTRAHPHLSAAGRHMAVANQTEEGDWPNKAVRASRPGEIAAMLGFLTILAAALAGLAGVGPWSVGAATIALASISYTQHQRLYERGQQSGSGQLVESTTLRSFANAMMAAGAAYGLGTLIHIL